MDYATVQGPMFAAMARSGATPSQYLRAPLAGAALTAAAGAAVMIANPLLEGAGIAYGGFMQAAVAAGIAASVGYAGGRWWMREPPVQSPHRRGTRIETAAAAAARDRDRPGRERGSVAGRDRPLSLAGTRVPPEDEAKHFKLIGTTGTGKSTAIAELLGGALRRGDRAVIADPDGGYLRDHYNPDRGDVILNPFDARSKRWDLFAEIETPYDGEQLARSMIPDRPHSDPTWTGYARTFFTAVTRQIHAAGEREPSELYRLLASAEPKELRALVEGTPAQPFLAEHNAKMFDSIRSVTVDAVSALQYVAAQDAPGQSVRRWVRDEQPGVLFMPYKAAQIAALSSSISAWMRLAIFETMNREPVQGAERGNRRLWFVIDELDALGPIDGLKDALARLRKFEGRCVIGLQSIAQVSSHYGQGEARTIIENCSNSVIFRCAASEGGGTARFASQLVGEREIIRTTRSMSRRYDERIGSITDSEQINVEPALLPSQIEQLPDLTAYLKYASNPVWQRVLLSPPRSAASERPPPAPATPQKLSDREARDRAHATRGRGIE
jgi:type IV secretory pathway TraG/TraD family ATPase VirD4